MDESRKAFEQWYRLNWGHTEDNEDSMFDLSSCHGNYHRLGVRMAYEAWKASREAIEIELPPAWYDENVYHVVDCDEMIEVIRAAGIKVKE